MGCSLLDLSDGYCVVYSLLDLSDGCCVGYSLLDLSDGYCGVLTVRFE